MNSLLLWWSWWRTLCWIRISFHLLIGNTVKPLRILWLQPALSVFQSPYNPTDAVKYKPITENFGRRIDDFQVSIQIPAQSAESNPTRKNRKLLFKQPFLCPWPIVLDKLQHKVLERQLLTRIIETVGIPLFRINQWTRLHMIPVIPWDSLPSSP